MLFLSSAFRDSVVVPFRITLFVASVYTEFTSTLTSPLRSSSKVEPYSSACAVVLLPWRAFRNLGPFRAVAPEKAA